MYDSIKTKAASLGFPLLYALPPAPIPWEPGPARTGEGLFADPAAAYPLAAAILLLASPYRSFDMAERIPAHYLAFHASYRAMNELCAHIAGMGRYAAPAKLPLRALARQYGIGAVGKNGLLRIPPYGSALVLQAIATDACPPQPFDPPVSQPCTPGCTACMDACPSGAISDRGLDVTRCMRLYMGEPSHPGWVKEKQLHFIGCEVCLRSCPFNLAKGIAEPPAEARAAFALPALIRGETAPARRLVGKNLTGNGKLTAEAIAFAARAGLYKEDISAALNSPFSPVREAVKWALERRGG